MFGLYLRKANTNDSSVKLRTTSKWIALVLAHAKRLIYTLRFCPLFPFTCIAPLKSTPETVNGDSGNSLSCGKRGGSGALYAFPVTFVKLTHFRVTHATSCLADGIQFFLSQISDCSSLLHNVDFVYECPILVKTWVCFSLVISTGISHRPEMGHYLCVNRIILIHHCQEIDATDVLNEV